MIESKQSHIQQFVQIQGQITPDVLVQFDPKSNSSKTLWAYILLPSLVLNGFIGRLAQLVERRTREHNVSGLYRRGFESPAGQLKLLIVFRMRR